MLQNSSEIHVFLKQIFLLRCDGSGGPRPARRRYYTVFKNLTFRLLVRQRIVRHVEGSPSYSVEKYPQSEREEYSDDEDPNDPFKELDVEEVIKTPPKRKRKPEIKSSEKKRKPLPKTPKKIKPRKRLPSSAASPSNVKRSQPNAKKSIPPPCEPLLSFSRQIRDSM